MGPPKNPVCVTSLDGGPAGILNKDLNCLRRREKRENPRVAPRKKG